MKNYCPAINEIVYDSTSKQYALITNGFFMLDEQGRETRKMNPEKYLEDLEGPNGPTRELFLWSVQFEGESRVYDRTVSPSDLV